MTSAAPAVERIVTKIEANPILVSRQNENRPLNVAAYCRVSTDEEDQLNSYEAQVDYYTEHILKNPMWRFAGIYADEGISGTLVSKRDNFKRMIRDCEKGKVDLVLTKSVSRFARNTVDSLSYIRKLKALGIGVFFEEQNVNSLKEDSEMYIGIYSVIAQTESENISANVKWGIQKRMKDGTYAFRYNLLGYRKGEDGEPEIVPEEAEVIRKVFSMFLDGCSTNQIKNHLEVNHILTKTGKEDWDTNAIRGILRNERYSGDVIFQKTYTVDCISKKAKVNRGEKPKYLVSNNHPAIIDRDTFKMVQMEMARRGSKRKISDNASTELGKYSGKYALSELLICGECGSPYRRRMFVRNDVRKVYWRCLNRIEHSTKYCKKSVGVEEAKLHESICKGLSKALPESRDVLELIKSNLSYAITGDDNTLKIFNIEQNIKELLKEAEELSAQMFRSESNKEKYEAGISEVYNRVKALRNQLEIAYGKIDQDTKVNSEIARISNALESEEASFKEFEDLTIRRIVDCIRVMPNKTITIILKGGMEITESIS